MCGRFIRESGMAEITAAFQVEEVNCALPPSDDVFPGQEIAIIIDDGRRRLVSGKWGFVPAWSKDAKIGGRMINARAETLTEKISFKSAFKKQRCLVAANGFYEWQKSADRKIPYRIGLNNNELLGLAGLYNIWKSPSGELINTVTIITTAANELLAPIHDRMPAIIPRNKTEVWLNTATGKETLRELLKPFDVEADGLLLEAKG